MSPRPPKVADKFATEVRTENRRVSGVTPRLLGSFPESPARMLPKARGLRGLIRVAGVARGKGAV